MVDTQAVNATDVGPLDWRIAIVDGAGHPTPEFQRRWATQRGNNALIGQTTVGSGAPAGAPNDGSEYVNTSTTPFTIYFGKNSAWHQAGTAVFTDLQDAPHSYTSNALNLVRVNSAATGVEFASQSAMLDTLGTAAQGDVLYRGATGWIFLTPGTSGQVFTTGGTAANPSWATVVLSGSATITGGTINATIIGGSTPAAGTFTIIQVVPVLTASLPTGADGDRAFVTDALSPVWGSALTGGGTRHVPVYYDGANTAWYVG